ncbi:MAG TPA: hypothetical protein VGC18_06575 [Lacisediminihabitans sp.]|uniref:hypothetical protein n=1 Tax=Lacisediminihabitans sp. TaxID=2787631 RepID=UPI002ED8C365
MSGEQAPDPRPASLAGTRRLGVRVVEKSQPDVRGLARAFVGVILARRFTDREEANAAMADYPARHNPRPRNQDDRPVK